MSNNRVDRLRKDDFYFPVLQQLAALGGSASVEELDNRLIEEFGFTDAELNATYPESGMLIVPNKIAWARSKLKIANLLDSGGRGIWVLTDGGRAAAAQGEAQVHELVALAQRDYMKRYHEKRRAKLETTDDETRSSPPAEETEEEVSVVEGESGTWDDRLLNKLQSIDPAAFERLCQRMLRESGFVRVEVTGKSGDGGIDGHGVLRMNLISFQVLFQCKRYKGSVSSGTVRDFRGAMQGRADKGLIITTGTFTPDARREATRDGAPAIDLIDGEALTGLLKSLELGVRVEQVMSERVSVDEAFFDEI